MNGKRKLAAILFADIVGYTKLMQANESAGLESLEKFKSIVNESVPRFGGEVVKNYGDGCLMLFDAPSSAIQCAIEMQKSFRKGKTIPVRIGAHIGEVIQTEDDYYGDGINIASRLETLAEPNSILISRAMKDQLQNKNFANTEYIGTVNLKNVEDIQEIYALSNKGLAVPSSSSIGSEKRSRRGKLINENDKLAKKKKAFGVLFGMCMAVSVMFIGFCILGVTAFTALGVILMLMIAFLTMMYFIMFGIRFDVFGQSDNHADVDEYDDDYSDEDQKSLDLKELDPQPRNYNKKDFI